MNQQKTAARTAGEAGWHVSRYKLSAPVPGSQDVMILSLMKGVIARYSLPEQYLLSVLEDLPEDHPVIERFAERGIAVNYDEYAALETMGRAYSAFPARVPLTVCPTMACNFDCPYCYEKHGAGKMREEVQDDIAGLAERLLSASRAPVLDVTWFGGEPLLCPDVIERLSGLLIPLAEKYHAEYQATAITNGYLLTEETAELLERCRVEQLQITLDGLGAVHDATRHLAGGGATFDRIMSNLSRKNPFLVRIRHNVHEGNMDEITRLRDFVKETAEKSGNRFEYYPAVITGSEAADDRGRQVRLLSGEDECSVGVQMNTRRLQKGRGHFCSANSAWEVGIDPEGNLVKCWEIVDKPEYAFGKACSWDPLRPMETADRPDLLTRYLNAAVPFADEECRSCVWLPVCAGGCPHARLAGKKRCVPYKDRPELYVRAFSGITE